MSEVVTASGAVYQFDGDRFRRIAGEPLRRDGEWLRLLSKPHIEVGRSMRLEVEPLGECAMTLRFTMPVVEVRHE